MLKIINFRHDPCRNYTFFYLMNNIGESDYYTSTCPAPPRYSANNHMIEKLNEQDGVKELKVGCMLSAESLHWNINSINNAVGPSVVRQFMCASLNFSLLTFQMKAKCNAENETEPHWWLIIWSCSVLLSVPASYLPTGRWQRSIHKKSFTHTLLICCASCHPSVPWKTTIIHMLSPFPYLMPPSLSLCLPFDVPCPAYSSNCPS